MALGEDSYFKPQDFSKRSKRDFLKEKSRRTYSSSSDDAYKGQMYESRMAASMTHDDIENQKFRVRKRKSSIENLRTQGVSVVEQALKNTKSRLYTFGSYLYSGYQTLQDIMNPESNFHNDKR